MTSQPSRLGYAPALDGYTSALADSRAMAADGRSWIVALGSLVFALTALTSRYLYPDTYMNLASGRYIARHGIPHHEIWTVAGQGREWIDQQWLAHLVYYGAWRVGGYPLLALLSTACIALAFAALTALIASRGVAPHRAALWTLTAFAGCSIAATVRAQSFAYPLFVGLLWLLFRDSRRGRPSWELAGILGLLVLWANVHGTVLVGVAAVVIHCAIRAVTVSRRDWRDAAVYLATAVAASVSFAATPYGFASVTYYRSLLGNDAVAKYIVEWQKPSLHHPLGYGFFVALVVAVAVIISVRRHLGLIAIEELAVLVALGVLASQGVRYQMWFVIATAFVAAASFRGAPVRALSDRFTHTLLFAAVAAAVAATVLVATTTDRTFERRLPSAAIATVGGYLAEHPDARVLADDHTSSALLWFEPAAAGRVAFDARLEQFRAGDLKRWMDYLLVVHRRWSVATRGYDVLLASKQNGRLVAALQRLPGWRRLYEDGSGLVLVRSSQ